MTYEAIGLFCESNNDFLKAEYYYRMGIDKKVNDYGILIDRLNNLGN